jgi:LPS O-antigen subunit length determinant protein (WzzB/FepE family)
LFFDYYILSGAAYFQESLRNQINKGIKMKRIILTLCIFFALVTTAYAGELYHCIGSNGKSIITDTPQDGMTKCVLKDSYDEPTPQERAQRQRQSKYQREAEETVNESGNQIKKRVALEKKYLERKKSGSSGAFVDAVDERIKELENDPDQYFYNKEQREKAAASQPKTAIDPRTGQVVPGAIIH